jgi:hypothetical protein
MPRQPPHLWVRVALQFDFHCCGVTAKQYISNPHLHTYPHSNAEIIRNPTTGTTHNLSPAWTGIRLLDACVEDLAIVATTQFILSRYMLPMTNAARRRPGAAILKPRATDDEVRGRASRARKTVPPVTSVECKGTVPQLGDHHAVVFTFTQSEIRREGTSNLFTFVRWGTAPAPVESSEEENEMRAKRRRLEIQSSTRDHRRQPALLRIRY